MKKRYFSTIFAAIFLLMMTSCVREQFAPGGLTGGEGYLYLTFGSAPNVEVSTKATLKAESENRIMNLYVFVFDNNGHKIHSKWYRELDRTNSVGETVVLEKDSIKIYDENRNEVKRDVFHVTWDSDAAEKEGFEHFMLKEIYEQPKGVSETLNDYALEIGMKGLVKLHTR